MTSPLTSAFTTVTAVTRHNLWRLLLLVGEDQHTRASIRNVEHVREIATDVGLLGIGFDRTGSACVIVHSPTVSEVISQDCQ